MIIDPPETYSRSSHDQSLNQDLAFFVGNRRFAAALDAGCGMRPHCKAALVRIRTSQWRVSPEHCFYTPVCFSLFPFCSFSPVFFPLSTSLLSQVLLSFNSALSIMICFFRIIQTLCLHFSRPTPLRKTLTINHYLRIEYFNIFVGNSSWVAALGAGCART